MVGTQKWSQFTKLVLASSMDDVSLSRKMFAEEHNQPVGWLQLITYFNNLYKSIRDFYFSPEHGTLTKLSNWLLCHTSWQCIQVSLAQNEEAPADFTVSCEERDSSSWRWGTDMWTYGCVWKWLVPLNPMVLLIIIPMKNGYFIGNIPNIFRQTHMWAHLQSPRCVPFIHSARDRRDPGDPRGRWQVLRRLFAEDGEAFRPGLEDFRDETLSQPLTNALAQGPQMETNAMAGWTYGSLWFKLGLGNWMQKLRNFGHFWDFYGEALEY